MANKQIIPFGMDFNQPLLVDDSLAIVPILKPTSLAIIPPKQRPQSYGQSYVVQNHQAKLPSPPEHLLLKDAPPKGSIVMLPKDVKLLPPKPNEMLMGVKLDKLGQVVYAKYTTSTPILPLMEFALIQRRSSSSRQRKT
jgi:hypothetical protein